MKTGLAVVLLALVGAALAAGAQAQLGSQSDLKPSAPREELPGALDLPGQKPPRPGEPDAPLIPKRDGINDMGTNNLKDGSKALAALPTESGSCLLHLNGAALISLAKRSVEDANLCIKAASASGMALEAACRKCAE